MALYREIGLDLPPDVFTPIEEVSLIEEFECGRCGFCFFDPRFAGSAAFYEALGGSDYYVENRPEFEFALNYLSSRSQKSRILDIGSGDGAFLDLAKRRNHDIAGLELNGEAAARARARGHTMISKSLAEISSEDVPLPLDAITMFHVLEHVPDPLRFVREAVAILRPGGALFIAVPNQSGLFRVNRYDPKNLPPHHISRWKAQHFRLLADSAGLSCKISTGDPLYGRSLLEFWFLNNRLALSIGRRPRRGSEGLIKLACLLYRKLGVRYILPPWGLSSYCVLEKR